MNKWKPITEIPAVDPETCCSAVLLGVWSNGSMMLVFYNSIEIDHPWRDVETNQALSTAKEDGHGYYRVYLTHWMHLPEPPVIESDNV